MLRQRLPLALFLSCALAACAAAAQESGAPVVLGGRTVFEVHWGFKTFTTEVRAQAIANRLRNLAEDPAADLEVSTHEADSTIDVMVGDVLVASVFPEDARIAGMTQETLAESWAESMREALVEHREKHRKGVFAAGAALTILTLALSFLAIAGEFRIARWLADRASEKLHARISASQRPLAGVLHRDQVQTVVWRIFRVLRLVGAAAILYAAFELVLFYFPDTRFMSREMLQGVLRPVRSLAAAFWRHLPGLIFIGFLGWATLQIVRLSQGIFRKIAAGELRIEGFRRSWANTTERLVSFMLVVLALLIAYPYIPGSDSSAFKGVTIFLGLLISLGSTGLISNLITGVLLTYTDAFQVGDIIAVGETNGVVSRTSLLVTQIRDRHNQLITIPNSMVLTSHVTNYSAPDEQGCVVETRIGVGYETPWRQVEELLLMAAFRTKGVLRVPPPRVLKTSLDQFFITYELSVHVQRGTLPFTVLSELNGNVLDACNEYGVQIMTPAYESDRQTPAVVPKDRWYAPPAQKAS